jgi:hypothetical protein
MCNIDVQSVSRPKNHRHSFKNGREKHGFIYVTNGTLLETFKNCEIDILCASKGELMFIPKGSVYTGTYLEEDTKIQIVQFDILSGELPEYLSVPTKIELPNAYELIESFFTPIENHISCHPFYYMSCLYRLLWEMDEHCAGLAKKYKKLQPALTEIIEFRNENKKNDNIFDYFCKYCPNSVVIAIRFYL